MFEHNPRVLFVLKYRDNPDHFYGSGLSSGLYNSARMVHRMLKQFGVVSHLVQVEDNNSIDREVTLFKPNIVIIEAFWVVPDKFAALTALHPNVTWVVRNHSELPFLAQEGIALDWIHQYVTYPKVYVASNSPHTNEELTALLGRRGHRCVYLPNYYEIEENDNRPVQSDRLNIGCFGAIRPLKNQLEQAVAAIQIGELMSKPINFHINSTRLEGNGQPILKNIRSLFQYQEHNRLIEHEWMPHENFLKAVAKMDLGLQVTFNETFNIVAADFASQWVPIVGASTIPWLPLFCRADPEDSHDIAEVSARLLRSRWGLAERWCLYNLGRYNKKSERIWLDWVYGKK